MRVILCGPGASGKDHLKQKFIDRGFKQSISCTTRPARAGEIDGVHYFFITEEDFDKKIEANEFLEYQSFPTKLNNEDVIVRYGTLNKHFKTGGIFIMTPAGIRDLTTYQRRTSMVIYLDIPIEIRRARLSERINGDDCETRLMNDTESFKDFTDFDMRVTNCDF